MLRIGTLLAALLFSFAAQAQLPLTGAGKGAPGGGGGGAYVGPVDVVATPLAFWGLRAMSAAYAGGKALNACNSTGGVDVGCADLLTDATTGALVSATVSGITCPGANCTVKTLYDQTGNCSGLCDFQQATVATRPTLVASCVGGKPCMTFASGQSFSQSGAALSNSQPFTDSIVAERTGNTSAYNTIMCSSCGTNQALFDIAPNKVILYGGGSIGTGITANDNVFHALQYVYNGASSDMNIDGTANTVSAGGATGQTGTILAGQAGAGANPFAGNLTEIGTWGIAFSSGQSSSMSSNQHSFWGF